MKIVNEELIAILGGESSRLAGSDSPPSVLMLAGLQGSGKTTTAAKLALHLKRGGHRVLLVAGDLRRPAAVEQLVTLGKQLDVPVYSEGQGASALDACRQGVQKARDTGAAWVILDTGGRLQIDDEMMEELEEIRGATSPSELLMVVDAMTGQDAVNSAQSFHDRIGLTGLVMTKLDGDARGGAALSITQVTGLPVKFIGTGERSDALEPFHPDRLASRILGMGDVLTLVEKAQETIDQERAKEMERKFRRATFNLEDFLEQLHQVNPYGAHQPGAGDDTRILLAISAYVAGGPGREAHEDNGGHCLLHDSQGAPQPGDPQRQPAAAYRQGQRDHAPAGEPAAQPVSTDAKGDEAGVLRQNAARHWRPVRIEQSPYPTNAPQCGATSRPSFLRKKTFA